MSAPENHAKELLIQFCIEYKNRNLPLLLDLLSRNINLWGSGIDEYRVGRDEVEIQLKRDWQQSESGEIEIISFVPAAANALWAAAICRAKVTIDGIEHIFEHLRGTIIIEEENGVWKISHMHTSFPDFRNPSDHSFPIMDQ